MPELKHYTGKACANKIVPEFGQELFLFAFISNTFRLCGKILRTTKDVSFRIYWSDEGRRNCQGKFNYSPAVFVFDNVPFDGHFV